MSNDNNVPVTCLYCHMTYIPQEQLLINETDYNQFYETKYGRVSHGVCPNIICEIGFNLLTAGGDEKLEQVLLQDYNKIPELILVEE